MREPTASLRAWPALPRARNVNPKKVNSVYDRGASC
jgi:hypothetical protein